MDMFEELKDRLAGDEIGIRLLSELECQFEDLAYTVDELGITTVLAQKELSAA